MFGTTGHTAVTKYPSVLGIIMLDTRFPRPVGDIGNPDTYRVATHREIVKGVWPAKVVTSAASMRQARLVPAFQNIVRMLQGRGVQAITTSCGFLVLLQKELQSVAKVPVVTSSLLQLPALLATQAQVGVLTISAASLGKDHLRAAGVPRERLADVIIQGMPTSSEFVSKIMGNQPTLDTTLAQQEVVAAALALRERAPQLTTLVLECTNLPPYKAQIEQATGWQVLSVLDDPRLKKLVEPVVQETAPELQNGQDYPSINLTAEISIRIENTP
jgi:hypothetical protein